MNQQRQEAIAQAEFDLHCAGFGWHTNNGGIHLQVTHEGTVVADYWPTVRKVNFRRNKKFDRTTFHDAFSYKLIVIKV